MITDRRSGTDRRTGDFRGGRRQEDYAHGTRIRYLLGCRCLPCAVEASSYSARRRTARAKGEWNGWVSPEHARRRLTDLESAGLGIRRVAELAGISPATVQRIKAGQGHIRAHVERALLELTPSLAHGALASGKASYTAKQLLNGLRAEGYATPEIAKRLGLRTKSLQYDAEQMRVRSVVRIRSLHHQLVVKERL